jgi:tetratricopeptide (TPR) repeat protein
MEDQERAYQEAMNLGHSAAWDQKWEQAAEHYRLAVEAVPDRVQAINNLGLAYFQLQRYDDAEVWYLQAAKLTPEDPLAVERLAQIYERTGRIKQAADSAMDAAELYLKIKDVDKAIENWIRVTRLVPEHLKAHSRLAVVHERLGRTTQAVEEYLAVAALMQDVGQVSKALQIVEKALALAPNNENAKEALVLVNSNKTLPKPKRVRGATGALRMAAVLEMKEESKPERTNVNRKGPDPISEARQSALTDLAGLLFEVSLEDIGDPDSSQSGLRSVFGRSKDGDIETVSRHLGASIDLQTRSQNDEAVKELKKAVDLGLEVPAAHFNLGLLYHSLKDEDKAARHLQRSLGIEKFSLAAYLLIAQQNLAAGQLQKAACTYLEALREADSELVPEEEQEGLRRQYELLIEEVSQKRDEEVLKQICTSVSEMLIRQNWRDHVLKTRREMPVVARGAAPVPLAEILTEAKDSSIVEALSHINEIAGKGHLRSAMEEAFLLVTKAPTYLPLHIQMADLMVRMGNQSLAVDKYKVVSDAYMLRGENKRATDLLTRVVELSPMDNKARTDLVQRLVESGEVDEAIRQSVNLADMQYRLAQLDQARKTYERAFRLAQQHNADGEWNIRILKQMADIDMQRLDWRQALRVYEQLRTLRPEDEIFRNRLVELHVRLGQTNQAVAEVDSFISTLETHARQDAAVSFLERLVSENEEMAFARTKLAELYVDLGRETEAIEQWDRVAELMVVQGKIESAKEAIRAILLLDPPNADQYRAALQQLG